MPEEDFSAVRGPGLSVSSEISQISWQKLHLDWTVAGRLLIRRHGKLELTSAAAAPKHGR